MRNAQYLASLGPTTSSQPVAGEGPCPQGQGEHDALGPYHLHRGTIFRSLQPGMGGGQDGRGGLLESFMADHDLRNIGAGGSQRRILDIDAAWSSRNYRDQHNRSHLSSR